MSGEELLAKAVAELESLVSALEHNRETRQKLIDALLDEIVDLKMELAKRDRNLESSYRKVKNRHKITQHQFCSEWHDEG